MFNNFYIILVEPAFASNIGSVARAMKNMGFFNLRIVNPQEGITDESYKLASNADDVLNNAKIYDNFISSVEDLNFLIATTARRGKRRKIYTIKDTCSFLTNLTISTKIGIVFGREKSGLKNEEIEICNIITHIPTFTEYSSLNLAQSVLIVCYEIFNKFENFKLMDEEKIFLPPVKEKEKFFKKMEEFLFEIDYMKENDAAFKMRGIRRFFNRFFMTKKEMHMLYGIIRQVRNYQKILEKRGRLKNE